MKKHTAILLICAMIFLLLAGCNQASTPDSSDTGTSTQQSTQRQTEKQTNKNKPEDTEMIKPQEDGVLKILTIGNSFSDDTMQYVYKIAKSAGVEKIKLGNLYIGGCSLDTHTSNAKTNARAYDYRTNSADAWVNAPNYRMKDAILSENWDFISLQQASGSSGIKETYANLQYMIDYVSSLAPDSKLVWNMTWAYQQDSTHGEFGKYGSSQTQMYQSILEAVQSEVATKNAIEYIVPNGTAIQNARTSYLGDTLTRDGFHLSLDIGRYIAGLTFFYQLTGISIKDIEFMPDGVDQSIKAIAIDCAINAVNSPWQVTASLYTEEPTFDTSLYDILDLGITNLAYWNSLAGRGMDTTSSNHVNFAASRLLTREDLPVGSVIVLAKGWRYRPEAWKTEGAQSSRPDNVTTSRIEITESWWGDYTHRAFNISKTDGSSLESLTVEDIENAFIIYVPKTSN